MPDRRFPPPRHRVTTSVASPAAPAMATPESRLMRQAIESPMGSRLQPKPSRVYVGKPVGWKIDSVGGTVWASAVSQNEVPGSMVRM